MPIRLPWAVASIFGARSAQRYRSQPVSSARLAFESLESRSLLAGLPFGAVPNDTAEYMLGEVYVSVVFMESSGTGANNTENWTPQQIDNVKNNISQGLQW